MDIVSLTFKNNDRPRSRLYSESRSRSPVRRGQFPGKKGFSGSGVRCYHCNRPHVRLFCLQLKQGIKKAGAADYRKIGSPRRKVTLQSQEPEGPKEETAKDGNQTTDPKICGACLIFTDKVN